MIQGVKRLQLPTFRAMCIDLGNPSARELARVLGVHARTVERWAAADNAPRSALLALFWLTRWGQSALDCELARRAADYSGHIEAVKRENDALRRELARVLAAGDFGAANRPTWRETPGELMARRRV